MHGCVLLTAQQPADGGLPPVASSMSSQQDITTDMNLWVGTGREEAGVAVEDSVGSRRGNLSDVNALVTECVILSKFSFLLCFPAKRKLLSYIPSPLFKILFLYYLFILGGLNSGLHPCKFAHEAPPSRWRC